MRILFYTIGILTLLLLQCSVGSADIFDSADKNSDGTLDKGEFKSYLDRVHKALDPLIDTASLPGGSDSSKSSGDAVLEASEYREDAFLKEILSLTGSGSGSGSDFVGSFINSLAMIIVTEIGDKTFFIAAVLAMRNGRLVVYLGAMLALGIMHLLSSLLGIALPTLLPRKYTHFASAVLFLYFGAVLLKDAMEKGEGPSEELQEVEEELDHKAEGTEPNDDDSDTELGGLGADGSPKKRSANQGGAVGGAIKSPGGVNGSSSSSGKDKEHGTLPASLAAFWSLVRHDPATALKQVLLYCNLADKKNVAVFSQAFTLTFLAEWGDRSQIATIALASVKNAYGVVLGGLIGHALCTGLAVVGGRLLAARISERTVAIIGGISFLGFGVHSFYAGP